MATLPTTEEKVRMVLDIFKHFGTRANEVLLPGNFVAAGVQKGFRNEDIADGLAEAKSRGLVEDTANGFIRLTDAGFDQV